MDIVVFMDADESIDSDDILPLVRTITLGDDSCIGVRRPELREPRPMTLPQQVGNRLACLLIQTLWRTRVSDLGPLRAIRCDRLHELDMLDRRFGWTAEMQIKAIQKGLRVCEVAVRHKRQKSRSKISGNLGGGGVMLAGWDILSTIFRLYRARHSATW